MDITPSSRYLVTGAAGFIGYHISKRLLANGHQVLGLDSLTEYYDPQLKRDRLALLAAHEGFEFMKLDMATTNLASIFKSFQPMIVIHLAAQAGVRYSLTNPRAYVDSNILAFFHILEACREHKVRHLLYASSSSVYGNNTNVPYSETDSVDHPISLYAATKRSNELMADTYSHLYRIPSTGMRFFTVYGPWGRPDMAYFAFADKHFSQESIHIFNNGDAQADLQRDFTYIEDVVDSIEKLVGMPPRERTPHRILNIGNRSPVKLMDFIATLETSLSRAVGSPVIFSKSYKPAQAGDVTITYADTSRLDALVGTTFHTPLSAGLDAFADWYVSYKKHSIEH